MIVVSSSTTRLRKNSACAFAASPSRRWVVSSLTELLRWSASLARRAPPPAPTSRSLSLCVSVLAFSRAGADSRLAATGDDIAAAAPGLPLPPAAAGE